MYIRVQRVQIVALDKDRKGDEESDRKVFQLNESN